MPGEKLLALAGSPVKAKLPDGEELVIHPFSLEDVAEMYALDTREAMTKGELARLRCYMVLRKVPGYETNDYTEWCRLYNAETHERLREVREAIDRANPTFRP